MTAIPLGAVSRDQASAEFFDAAAQGELLIRRCRSCAHFQGPGRGACPHCGSDQWDWVHSEGRGELIGWARIHAKKTEDGQVPTALVGIVQLAEGPWMHARIEQSGEIPVEVGQRLKVEFRRPQDSESLPVFFTD